MNICRFCRCCVAVFLLASPALPPAARAQADLFKSGRIRLVEECRTSDDSLPEEALFRNPRYLAVDDRGNVFISDFDANHIKVFGPDGAFQRLIGRPGQGPGELSGPSAIAVAGRHLIVWEAIGRRFSVLTLDGKCERTAPGIHGAYGDLIDLKALPDGRIVAWIDRGLPANSQGRLPEEGDYAVLLLSPDLKPVKTVFERKLRGFKWFRHPETQAAARAPFPFHPKLTMDVSPQGTIAVGLSRGYEIEWHDADEGRIASVARPYTPLKIEERDKAAHFSVFKMRVIIDDQSRIINKAPDYIVANTEFPENLPPFRGIIFDGRGNLWVQLYTPDRIDNVFDVFSPDGEFLNRIAVAGGPIETAFSYPASKRFHGDLLWKIEKDAEEFSSLVKYRVTAGR